MIQEHHDLNATVFSAQPGYDEAKVRHDFAGLMPLGGLKSQAGLAPMPADFSPAVVDRGPNGGRPTSR